MVNLNKQSGCINSKMIYIILTCIMLFNAYPYLICLCNPKYNIGKTAYGVYMREHPIINTIAWMTTWILCFQIWNDRRVPMVFKFAFSLCIYLLFWPTNIVWNGVLSLFVNSKPYVQTYPSVKRLEDNYSDVKNELDQYIAKQQETNGEPQCLSDTIPGFSIGDSASNCWRSIDLKRMGKLDSKLTVDEFPFLYDILSNPRILNVFLSILDPGVNIPIHSGYSKGVLRYHLGYKIPKDNVAFIENDGIRYHWKEGEGVMFDDMFMHYVENPSDEQRIVLYCDVLCDLPSSDSECNDLVYRLNAMNPVLISINKSDHVHKKME